MDSIDFAIERRILRIGNHVIAVRNQDLKKFGLTSSQSEALLGIERDEGSSIVSLKERLNVSHQAVQKTVGRLREKGLVDVVASAEDARAKCVSLTEAGRRLCAELKQAGAHSGRSILGRLDDQERRLLLGLLDKIEID